MDGMDISPYPPPPVRRTSSTPASHLAKRLRGDTDYMDDLVDSVLPKRTSSTSCTRSEPGSPRYTPPRSPTPDGTTRGMMDHGGVTPAMGGGAPSMCTTPLAGFATDGAALAASMGVRWGVQQRQGPRSTQEDCVACRVDDRGFPHGFFGVFDGHGGCAASEYAADCLHRNVLTSAHFPADVLSALQDAFLRTDCELLRRAAAPPRRKDDDCGTAAATCIVTHDAIALAHAGDCRAILVKRSGAHTSFVPLTHDHSAERIPLPDGSGLTAQFIRPDEVQRVQRAGARMDPGGYVCVGDHSLPMTRALGDLPLKVPDRKHWRSASVYEQVVTALPDVHTVRRAADDLCIVLATDGLFGNVMPSEEVARVARELLEGTHAHAADAEKQTARALTDRALSLYHGSDNASVVVIGLTPPADGYPSALLAQQPHLLAVSSAEGGGVAAAQAPAPSPHDALATAAAADDDDEDGVCYRSIGGAAVASSSSANDAGGGGVGAGAMPRSRPAPLSFQGSQESVTTADPCSPGRLALIHKLRCAFIEAYPCAEGEIDVGDPDYLQPSFREESCEL